MKKKTTIPKTNGNKVIISPTTKKMGMPTLAYKNAVDRKKCGSSLNESYQLISSGPKRSSNSSFQRNTVQNSGGSSSSFLNDTSQTH
jgi:hypothetical protein